ncbi:uncharacterized protein clos [Fopius arisanus]|uniref:Uncharacterized protein clos n=1 Tax=Fopius arisanus TaxID=64838 RepID=A0A9R1SYF0_9HYME|nr:PREDICTED: uncharacterized protein LOC105264331 [Fopius arisanus]
MIWSLYCSLLFLVYPTATGDGINHLEKILNDTTNFFEKLKVQFGSSPANNETFESINNRVDEFIDHVSRDKKQRSRRQLFQENNYETETSILHGFQAIPGYTIPNATDISFFMQSSNSQLHWVIGILDPNGISLLRFDEAKRFTPVYFFPLENGEQILADSRGTSTLLIIRQCNGIIKVLRSFLTANGQMTMILVQTLPTTGATHAGTWRGLNRLYLGVSFPEQLRIYVWQGENFDQIEPLDIGAERIIPLQTGGTMVLAATGITTRIISFQLKSDKFIVTQELPSSEDAASFQRENSLFVENFLVLTGINSTIIYRERKHRYIPYQRLEGAHQVQALSSDRKVLLFLIQRLGGMRVFQYDGWRYSDLQIYMPKVTQLYPTFLPDGSFVLAMKSSDHNQWTFQRMIWRKKKTWDSLKEDILKWCTDSLQAAEISKVEIPTLKHPLVFQNVRIKNLTTQSVNGRGSQEFSDITRIYKRVISRLEDVNKHLETAVSLDKPVFTSLSAESIRVMSKVITMNMNLSMPEEFISKLRTPGDPNKNMIFENVRTTSIDNFKCPIPAIRYEEISVTGLVNGISFQSFVDDALKTNEENQTIKGRFSFDTLIADDADLDIDVAWKTTRQELRFMSITAEDLHTASGYLLPLDGDPVTMTGDLTVSRVKMGGLVDVRGPIQGVSGDRMRPMTDISAPMVLEGHYHLADVKIDDLLEAEDLSGPNGESYREIRRSALPLRSKSIPIHMKFLSKNVEWNNVTLIEPLGKWITTRSPGVNVTGMKTVSNLTVSQSVYEGLPLPVISTTVCALGVFTPDIYTTNITLKSLRADLLKAVEIFGALELEDALADAARSWEEVPWELKNITGEARVVNSSISQVADVDLRGLHESLGKWSSPGVLKGPIHVKTLRVKNVMARKGFNISLPKIVSQLEALGNVNVKWVNGIDILEFIDNAVELDDMISLTNITFLGGLSVESITTTTSSIPLLSGLGGIFGAKTITGPFNTEHLIIPDLLAFPTDDGPVEFVVIGNVTFTNEPTVEIINNVHLDKLSDEIWMKDKPATFKGRSVFLENVTLEGAVEVLGQMNTPGLGPWSELREKIFSKSLDQEIPQKISIKSLHAGRIIGSPTSRLISSPSTGLYDLEFNSLRKNGDQTISSPWSFESINIQGNVTINGVINDLDLNKDVLRTDVENNVITGKIIVNTLTATNIDGLKFDEFARNTLKRNDPQELVVIKGKKTFNSMRVKSLSLTSIKGKRIESCLLRHSNQTITGKKMVTGRLRAPGIVTEGLINDVDLTKLLVYQLKKNSSFQVIETPIVFQNGLRILGNLTIDGPYQGVQVESLGESRPSALRVMKLLKQLANYSRYAEDIDLVFSSRAFYFDKLELIEESSTPSVGTPGNAPGNQSIRFDVLGDCSLDDYRLRCNSTGVVDLSGVLNSSHVLELKAGALGGSSRIVCVTSAAPGGVSIYSIDEDTLAISKEAELLVPGVLQASVATYMGSIWIVLGLQDNMMILRYRDGFQEFVIPPSEYFALSPGLGDELLLFRNDGVWRIGGVAGTKMIFKANLKGNITVARRAAVLYVQLCQGNDTSLLQAHYVGN